MRRPSISASGARFRSEDRVYLGGLWASERSSASRKPGCYVADRIDFSQLNGNT